MKCDLTEKGKPCARCPWPDSPSITPMLRLAAEHGEWFACHVRGGGTCYGALAVSKRHFVTAQRLGRLRVQKQMCATCIFRPESALDLNKLLDDVREKPGVPGFEYFGGYRICHHSHDACCAGFWAKYRDKFTLGQVAQRLHMVEFVHDDNQKEGTMSNRNRIKREQRLARQHGEHFKEPTPPRAPLADMSEEEVARHVAMINARLNSNLERKAAEAAQLKLPLSGKGLPAVVHSNRKPRPEQQPVCVITHHEFVTAFEEARAAGRTDLTIQELERLLALPYHLGHESQRRYLRSL